MFHENIGGRICYGHVGSIRGYQSFILYDTTLQAIVCVLINSNPSPVGLVTEQLLLTLVNNPVSITENLIVENSITIYPNPTKGIFTVDMPSAVKKGEDLQTVEIININGQTIKQLTIDNNKSTIINLKGQSKGIYFVKITNDDIISMRKIVIQ